MADRKESLARVTTHDATVIHNAATGMDPYLIAQAQEAAEREKAMPFKEAFPIYWKGMLWSVLLSIALVMEGFDVSLTGAYYGQPYFQKRFGEQNADGEWHISANWQSGLGNASNVGAIIGLLLNGYLQYTFGSKRTYIGALIMITCAIFIFVFGTDIRMLLAGQFIIGVPWGVFQTLTTAYAAEICPMACRAYLTSFVNICWAAGLFIGAGTLRGTLTIPSDWSWRLPYCLQWAWVIPLLAVGIFAPESPWYLVRVGRIDAAKRSISRTCRAGTYQDHDLDAQIALMQHTYELEAQDKAKQSVFNCFKGTNLRRVEICCIVWMIQQWCGQPMTGFTTIFLQNVGMDVDRSFDINLGSMAMLVFGTIVVWFGMGRWGRRTIYLSGQLGMAALLLIMGVLGCVPASDPVIYCIAALLLLLNLVFACTLGPACYTIVGEMPAAEVRGPTIVLARASYVISGIVTTQITPRMITTGPDAWGWGAKGAFFYLGTSILGITWTYFRLPESRGFTFGQLDVLFHNKISARKFTKVDVDEFMEQDATEYTAEKDAAEVEHKEVKA